MPIDGQKTYDNGFFQTSNPAIDLSRHIAGKGSVFKIEGVKIEFIKSGDYETVRLSLDN
jgi:hypothetical protein